MAAMASAVIAPMVVAWVENSIRCQMRFDAIGILAQSTRRPDDPQAAA